MSLVSGRVFKLGLLIVGLTEIAFAGPVEHGKIKPAQKTVPHDPQFDVVTTLPALSPECRAAGADAKAANCTEEKNTAPQQQKSFVSFRVSGTLHQTQIENLDLTNNTVAKRFNPTEQDAQSSLAAMPLDAARNN